MKYLTETSPIKVRLTARGESVVRSGHPWVYSDSVRSQSRSGSIGDFAVIYNRDNRFLAIGFWDPESPIRIRILHTKTPVRVDATWWETQLYKACERRMDLSNADSETTGYRCINGESDGFPGLVADRYEDTLVVKLYTASWLVHWQQIVPVLRSVLKPGYLLLRFARNLREQARAMGYKEGFIGASGEEVVHFKENGMTFESLVLEGQKTGFFLDQRENRLRVQALACNREVLNLFSFSGGFSLYAARGGACAVTDVDISQHALDSVMRNYALNPHVAINPEFVHRTVQADIFEWFPKIDKSWGLIIVDPPSLAPRRRDKDAALRAYRQLNQQAIRHLTSGGILVASSCSSHITAEAFFTLIEELAITSGKSATLLWKSQHPSDHPATFPEAYYLKAIAYQFGTSQRE